MIHQLYQDSYSVLMSVAVRYFKHREDQMEIVNLSFMRIIHKMDTFRLGEDYYKWAKTIAHHIVIDQFRKDKRYNEFFVHPESEQWMDYKNNAKNTGEDYLDIEEFNTEEVEHALQDLPPATRLTFNLFAIDGYSYNEIKKELGVSYETVKWHIKDARRRLRKKYKHNTLERRE